MPPILSWLHTIILIKSWFLNTGICCIFFFLFGNYLFEFYHTRCCFCWKGGLCSLIKSKAKNRISHTELLIYSIMMEKFQKFISNSLLHDSCSNMFDRTSKKLCYIKIEYLLKIQQRILNNKHFFKNCKACKSNYEKSWNQIHIRYSDIQVSLKYHTIIWQGEGGM